MKLSRFVWGVVIVTGVCLASYGGYLLIRNRAYAHIEQLTLQYAHEVEPYLDDYVSKYGGVLVYFKVFEYEQVKTKVFVTLKRSHESEGMSGSFYRLERDTPGDDWELVGYPTLVWSLYGSADGCTWPPYGPVDPFSKHDD